MNDKFIKPGCEFPIDISQEVKDEFTKVLIANRTAGVPTVTLLDPIAKAVLVVIKDTVYARVMAEKESTLLNKFKKMIRRSSPSPDSVVVKLEPLTKPAMRS